MNKDEAITKFVKKNFTSLTSVDLDKVALKFLVREFFVSEHNKKFGQPKSGQICESLVKYQIRNGVSQLAIESQFESLPIYKNIGDNKLSEFRILIGGNHQTVLSEEDLSRIEISETYGAITSIESDKIRREFEQNNKELIKESQRLNKAIIEKQSELLSIPSILDETAITEPEFSPEVEDVKSWWQRFYLKSNPFPGNKDGLSKINSSLYEQVVVKTKPYQTLINNVDNNTATIFDTAYMLVGDFGYGKTTLQDYLSYYLASKNILPIRITCMKAQPDCNGYLDYFNQKLIKELSREINGSKIKFDPSDPDLVIDMCLEVCEKRDGIIIFLDDYHKHRSEYLEIYDFLGTLQILKNQLTRNDVNAGFIVSSIPEWEKALPDHQQMSGFFDSSPIVMPAPTPEFIRSVFNQRISAYCYDTSPREIEIEFIEQIFYRSENKGNYRDYLNRIIEELDNNNMAIVSSPIEIDDVVLGEIKALFIGDPSVWSPLQKLLQGSRFKKYNEEQISKCLELLVISHTQKGVNENEPIFTENKFYFSRLKETGLISKKKDSKSSNNFSWVTSPSISKCTEKVNKIFGYNLQDYFLKIFSHKNNLSSSSAEPTREHGALSKFKSFINDNKLSITEVQLDKIEESLVLYDKFDVNPSSKQKTDQAVQDMMQSLNGLSNSLFDIDGSLHFFQENNIKTLEDKWRNHHVDGEIIDQFIVKTSSYNNTRDAIQYSLSARQAKDAFNFICERIKLIVLDIKPSSEDRFGYGIIQSKQNPVDIIFYDSIRGDLYSPSKEVRSGFLDQTKGHVEKSMKKFLYTSTVMAFGEDDYFKNSYPNTDSDQFIKKPKTYSEVYSHYAFLPRDELKNIFLNGSLVKSMIIDNLGLSWSSESWDSFFDIFIENSSEELSQDSSVYSKFCKLSVELIGAMNTMVSNIPISSSYIILDNTNDKIDSVMFKSGFSVLSTASNQDHVLNIDSGIFQKDSKYERHVLDPVMYGRIKKQILKNVGSQQIFENMMDFTYIHDHYKVKYYEFVLSLVYLERIEKLITIKSWFGSHVVISKKESAIKPILSNVDIDTHHFDVSLSFPGESRGYVLELVKELHLKLGEGKYFYDHTYQAQLARPDLDNLLQEIYGKRTKLVVVFLSKNYDNKPWCGLEFRAIKELIMEKQAKKVMLVKVGDGDVKGIMKGDGYIDAEKTPPNLLSKYIQERLATL